MTISAPGDAEPIGVGATYSLARLRQGGAVFLIGKLVTASLNLVTLYLVAGHLPTEDFALYAWLLALGALVQSLSMLGLDWIALHQLPDLYGRASGRVQRRFLVWLLALRQVTIVLPIGVLVVAAPLLVAWFGEPGRLDICRWFLMILAVDLTVEFWRNCVLGPLLRQVELQVNVLVQRLAMLGCLWMTLGPEVGVAWAILGLAAGAGTALVVSLVQLFSLFWGIEVRRGTDDPPRWSEMLRFGADNYVHDLLHQFGSGHLMTVLASRLVSPAQLAVFGFVHTLAQNVDRLLPIQLLVALVRPWLVVRYRSNLDLAGHAYRTGLILKFVAVALAYVAVITVAFGDSILGMLSSDRYTDGYGLAVCFLLWLAVANLRRVVSMFINVIGQSGIVRRSATFYLLAMPTSLMAYAAGLGVLSLVIGLVFAELASIGASLLDLDRKGIRPSFNPAGHVRVLGATVIGCCVGLGLAHILPEGTVWTICGMLASAFVLTGLLAAVCPWTAQERSSIRRLLRRMDK